MYFSDKKKVSKEGENSFILLNELFMSFLVKKREKRVKKAEKEGENFTSVAYTVSLVYIYKYTKCKVAQR